MSESLSAAKTIKRLVTLLGFSSVSVVPNTSSQSSSGFARSRPGTAILRHDGSVRRSPSRFGVEAPPPPVLSPPLSPPLLSSPLLPFHLLRSSFLFIVSLHLLSSTFFLQRALCLRLTHVFWFFLPFAPPRSPSSLLQRSLIPHPLPGLVTSLPCSSSSSPPPPLQPDYRRHLHRIADILNLPPLGVHVEGLTRAPGQLPQLG